MGEISANVSVRMPLRPTHKKPEGAISSDEKVAERLSNDSAPRIKKEPSFARKGPEKKGSWRFEQDDDENHPKMPPAPAAKPRSSYSGRDSTAATPEITFPSEAEAMADAWEKEKLAKIKKQ